MNLPFEDFKKNDIAFPSILTWKLNSLTNVINNGMVPKEKNKLIYFDGDNLVSEYLMYSEGLVVDNNEDLEYCQSNAEISLSTVLSEWTSYGSDQNDNNDWGYCDSIPNDSDNPDKCNVTLVGKDNIIVPSFKLNGKPQDYIFNTTNTDANTGFFTPKKYSNYDVTVCVGSFDKFIDGSHDYLGNLIAINSTNSSDLSSEFYGISLHTLLLYPDGGDGVFESRPNYAEKIQYSTDGIYYMPGSTIQITSFIQKDLNSEDSYNSHENNIPILSISEGLKIVPLKDYNSEIHGSDGESNSYGIQSRVIRKGDIFTIYFSDAYRLYEDNITMVDDSNYSVDKNRSVVIDLSNYTLKYTYYEGDIVQSVTKKFENGLGTSYINPIGENTEYTEEQINKIKTIFDNIKTEAHRGFESKSTGNGFFRYVSGFDEKILDIRSEKNCVYKFENGSWNITGENPFDLLKNGSRLAWNKKTNKLFYNDGLSVYQIASSSESSSGGEGGGSEYSAGTNISIENNTISVVDLPSTFPPLNTDNFVIDGVKMTMVAHPFRFENGEKKDNNHAGGDYSTVVGFECKTEDNAKNSFCGGDTSIVKHQVCFAHGKGLETGSPYQTVLGKFNKPLNNWGETIPLIIGWGEDGNNRKNLLVLQNSNNNTSDQSGDGGLMTYGPLKPGANYINDFSEYFEWFDGNPNNEDRVGYMVQLNGEKIEFADSFEKCIGIISVTSAFVGNSCSLEWHGRYLKDDFGRIICEEIDGKQVLKINPNYDDSLEYIPRDRRKEWGNVGILGQILVRQDGTLEAGDYAGCINGIATKSTDNKGYRVLKIVSDKVALVLVK